MEKQKSIERGSLAELETKLINEGWEHSGDKYYVKNIKYDKEGKVRRSGGVTSRKGTEIYFKKGNRIATLKFLHHHPETKSFTYKGNRFSNIGGPDTWELIIK